MAVAPSPSAGDSSLSALSKTMGLPPIGEMLAHAQDAALGRRHVGPELAAFEADRYARLSLARNEAAASRASLLPLWPRGAPFDLLVYLSTAASLGGAREDLPEEDPVAGGGGGGAAPPAANVSVEGLRHGGPPLLLWRQRGLRVGDSAERAQSFLVTLPPEVLANETGVYAHVFFRRAGAPLAPSEPGFSAAAVLYHVQPLVKLLQVKPKRPRVSLLGDGGSPSPPPAMRFGIQAREVATLSGSATPSPTAKPPPEPYWKPALRLQLVDDQSPLPPGSLPPPVALAAQLQRAPGSGAWGYLPHLYVNEFWLLGHHLHHLNASAPPLPLEVALSGASMWRWMVEAQYQTSMDMQVSVGMQSERQTDYIKALLTDTNPWLLALTVVVSLLHSVFDFLAFKNDITFWRGRKNMEGLSVRTVAMSVFSQGVIMLYLFDFGDTSPMVLLSIVAGFCIECWKLLRAVGGRVEWKGGAPSLDWGGAEDAAARRTAAYKRTQEYDEIATSHLLCAMVPLSVGSAAYSLAYDTHKGWYSWLVGSLASFVYMFGFAHMVPQLYINYRLKSVAHMPWKTMMYKSLNTFIDVRCGGGGGGAPPWAPPPHRRHHRHPAACPPLTPPPSLPPTRRTSSPLCKKCRSCTA